MTAIVVLSLNTLLVAKETETRLFSAESNDEYGLRSSLPS